jgi:GR25 family glycosyltransferase involved in LPS biosynthesis
MRDGCGNKMPVRARCMTGPSNDRLAWPGLARLRLPGSDYPPVLTVLYINLDRDRGRRAHIERELGQDDLRPLRIHAVGPLLPHGMFTELLSAGEIGVYASHMKAWRTLLGSNDSFALVLEDDARLPPNLAELIAATVATLPQDWDLVHLYEDDPRPARPLRTITGPYSLVRYSRVPRGSVGYLISRSGAHKLSRPEPRRWPLDTDFRRPWHFRLESYGVRPPLVTHADEFPSALLAVSSRSRRRRGIVVPHPLHSLWGASWNVQRLGIRWWLYSLALNSWRRFGRAMAKLGRQLFSPIEPTLSQPPKTGVPTEESVLTSREAAGKSRQTRRPCRR